MRILIQSTLILCGKIVPKVSKLAYWETQLLRIRYTPRVLCINPSFLGRLTICAVITLVSSSVFYAQTSEKGASKDATASPQSEDANVAVQKIVKGILERGEGRTESGIRTTTFMPPNDEEVAEIKDWGEQAINPLTQFLDSDEPRAQLLAVRLLGVVGGPDIIPPLKRALEPNRWVVVRTQALSSLMSAPRTDSIPLIHEVLSRDPDPQVQARGRDVLTALGESKKQ
jgi:HEAT repeat protein